MWYTCPLLFHLDEQLSLRRHRTGRLMYVQFTSYVCGVISIKSNAYCNLLSGFIKKETLAQLLSCEFCKIFKNTFVQNKSGACFCRRQRSEPFISLYLIYVEENTANYSRWICIKSSKDITRNGCELM